MTISIDLIGAYYEHKEFFDELAKCFQKAGHRVGIITGEREVDPYTGASNRERYLRELGFKPDFFYLWGPTETIANGEAWKVQRMMQEEVAVHFDDDADKMKKYTDLWIIKTMNSAEKDKF